MKTLKQVVQQAIELSINSDNAILELFQNEIDMTDLNNIKNLMNSVIEVQNGIKFKALEELKKLPAPQNFFELSDMMQKTGETKNKLEGIFNVKFETISQADLFASINSVKPSIDGVLGKYLLDNWDSEKSISSNMSYVHKHNPITKWREKNEDTPNLKQDVKYVGRIFSDFSLFMKILGENEQIVIDAKEYQKLIDNQKPVQKTPAKKVAAKKVA